VAAWPEPPATAMLTPHAASERLRERELSRVAQSLMSGRLLISGPESSAGVAYEGIELDATEAFNPDAAAAPSPAVAIEDHASAVPAADGSGSAVLPGGTHVSEVDSSGRRQPFFRSVAQI